MADRTDTSTETQEAEETEARAVHQADRMPTEDEAATAEREAARLEESGDEGSVAAHHREMDERGAHVKGEGQID